MPDETRREFGRTFAAGLSAAALGAQGPARRSRPNILFVCSDQHSFKYTGYTGHPLVKTPNLDRVARQGVIFNNAYCGSPVCVPGRASMMTGMYPSDSNSFCNSTVWDGSQPTWGARLRKAGYDCRATGKLDLNPDFDIGFREIETSHGHRRRPDITSLFRRPVAYRIGERNNVDGRARDRRHPDAERTATALEFIRNGAPKLGTPWVQYVGLTEPHPAFVALRKYYEMYPLDRIDLPRLPPDYLENQHLVFQELRHFKRIATPIPEDRMRRARAAYYGMVSELDEYIGQLWDALAETKQLENTVFVYTSDHGEALGEHGLWLKNNLLDPAARIPLLMAGGALPQGRKVDTAVAQVDMVATLLELGGAESVASLRGHSLLPLIEGRTGNHPGFAYSESHSEGNCTGSFMIRKGDWKYLHFSWYDDLLYNVAEDPGEFRNRAEDPAARPVLQELRDILHSEVNPEEVTRRAFDKQERMLASMTRAMTEDQLVKELAGRLGAGQARVLAAKCKKQFA